MEFFYVVKATQKSGKPDAVVWFTAKTEARANLQLDVELEEADIETGRGQDYNKPIRTDFPVFNDLPEESTVDLTWCERYELAEDMRTWQLKPGSKPDDAFHGEANESGITQPSATNDTAPSPVVMEEKHVDLHEYGKYPYEKKVLGTWLFGLFENLNKEQQEEVARVELDMDETYAQNVLLAARDFKARAMEHVFPETLAALFTATKSIWPVGGKAPMLNDLITFFTEWISTHHSDTKSRDDVTAKWFAKHRKAPTATPTVETMPAPEPVQAPERYKRSVAQNMANMGIEIAVALLYPDAVPGQITRQQLIGAKDVVEREEEVHVKAVKVLGKITDIMSYDATSIFAVTRFVKWNSDEATTELRTNARNWLAQNGVYEDGSRSKGYPEWEEDARKGRHPEAQEPVREDADKMLAAGRGEFVPGISDPADLKWVKEDLTQSKQPAVEVSNIGAGIFSFEGLMADSKLYGNKSETTSNVQMVSTTGKK